MKKRNLNPVILSLSLTLFLAATSFAQTANVQIIHNSPDQTAEIVDLYINDQLYLSDLRFRTATPFVEIPADVPLKVSLVGKSAGSMETILWNAMVTFDRDRQYILIANGLINEQRYQPFRPFYLFSYPEARIISINADTQSDEAVKFTDILIFHGATDAPDVDILEVGTGAGTIISNFSYGSFTGYLSLPTRDYIIQLNASQSNTILSKYSAPLKSLGLEEAAMVVLASGFVNPESNFGGASFGLFAVLPTGGDFIPLPVHHSETLSTARVQIIHNSADAAASLVDVWLNDTKLLENFAFRTASPFFDAPAGVEFTISIKAPESNSPDNPIWAKNYNLESGKTYILVANGMISTGGYNPNQPFEIHVFGLGREFSESAQTTDVLVYHGATDAPKVTVWETGIGAGQIIPGFEYGDFAGYLSLPLQDYSIQIRDETGSTVLFTYFAPLQTLKLGGYAITVLASGFVNPTINNNGAPFGLYVALPSGGTLVPLTGLSRVSQSKVSPTIQVFPNPATDYIMVSNEPDLPAIRSISIINVLGNVVKHKDISVNSTETVHVIPVSDLAEGLYFVEIYAKNQRFVQKVRIIR